MEWVEGEQEQDGSTAQVAVGSRAHSARRERGGEASEQVELSGRVQNQRILELELENLRLTRLVADLLLKNQRLRESN